jgi:phage terminase large subunit
MSDKRYVLNSGGVGSGKSYSIVIKTLSLVLNHPGIFILIGAQTYPLLRDTTLREFLNVVPGEIIKSYNKTNQHFTFVNGSEVIFRSFDDPSKLKSLNLGACGIEEMTDIPEEIFKMLRTRMRQDKMPGCIFGATNPSTFGNWVYKYFIENPLENSEVIYSVSSDNFFLPQEYIKDLETMKITNPQYYARMIEGKWGEIEGLIYNLPMSQRVPRSQIPSTFDRIVAGLDFGYSHPTAMIILGVIGGTYYVIDEVYQRGLVSQGIVEIVKAKVAQWGIQKVYCDWARPEIIKDLQSAGLPCTDAIKDVFDGIMYTQGLVNTAHLYVCTDCTYTLREFDSYVNGKDNKPAKVNDDAMDGLRYGVFSDRIPGFDFRPAIVRNGSGASNSFDRFFPDTEKLKITNTGFSW